MRRFRPHLSLRYNQIRLSSHRADHTKDYLTRVARIEEQKPKSEWYPRLRAEQRTTLKQINEEYGYTKENQTIESTHNVVARINAIRTAGSKLIFVDLTQDEHSLQVILKSNLQDDVLKAFIKTARKGDTYAFSGQPHRTRAGQLSILVDEAPQLLSPCLHQIPDKLTDVETLSHYRYVEMLVDPNVKRVLRTRHMIERTIDTFLEEKEFVKVTTPILQASAGGATARPFKTEATEVSRRKLDLRIAPELWLKRLIVGGLSRVYEIGPVFRNEGVDATHNPEFSTCEFYAAHITLAELMQWTEQLIRRMADQTKSHLEMNFHQLEFIPTVEAKLGYALPDLKSDDASAKIIKMFEKERIHVPQGPSLPRLLDALAGHFIEPLCDHPTFITHHPAALSPLAKHFKCPLTGQIVSARAELFIKQREIANMYEEQNSPFAQHDAFAEQLQYRNLDGEGDGEVDDAYIEALEWGMPPTGGWGCGIDRLVMLFAEEDRIARVLPFGLLTHVVNVGRGR